MSIILIIFIFQSLIIRNLSSRMKNLNEEVEQLKRHSNILKHNYISSWKLERKILIDNIYDENEQKVGDNFFDHEYPVLFFRFSQMGCMDCVIKQIDIIKELVQNSTIKYMMICDYSNKRNLGMFKRMNEINNTVYDCKKLIDNETGALYFCIYYQGFVSDVFFPDENFPELTRSYLKEISKKYFTDK